MIRILHIGDIFGKAGRTTITEMLPKIRAEYSPDLVIANGENLANGLGMTPKTTKEMFTAGIDIFTSGNHLWDKKEIIPFLEEEERILRPANYPQAAPGKDYYIFSIPDKGDVAIINLLGQVFLPPIDSPFRCLERYYEKLRPLTPIIFVDFHAEATAEKAALAWYFDGKVSAVCGTHTHVQTADERLLPQKTAFISDVGMTGAHDSIIGITVEQGFHKFLVQTPTRFSPAQKNLIFNGAIIDIDETTGDALAIKRLNLPLSKIDI